MRGIFYAMFSSEVGAEGRLQEQAGVRPLLQSKSKIAGKEELI